MSEQYSLDDFRSIGLEHLSCRTNCINSRYVSKERNIIEHNFGGRSIPQNDSLSDIDSSMSHMHNQVSMFSSTRLTAN